MRLLILPLEDNELLAKDSIFEEEGLPQAGEVGEKAGDERGWLWFCLTVKGVF